MEIDGFTLVNIEKVDRAINGAMTRGGVLINGVGEQRGAEGELLNGAEILAKYDSIGGLVLKGKHKVKTGSFFDFKTKKARAKPEVLLVFRDLENNEVEVPADEPIPVELRAAEMAQEKQRTKNIPKKKKKAEDDEEVDE